MIVYLYDYATGFYLGEQQLDASDCDPRTLGRMLIPGNATIIPPPRCGKGLWPRWINGAWGLCEFVPDPIATDYYLNL